jgi:hypothetical protein
LGLYTTHFNRGHFSPVSFLTAHINWHARIFIEVFLKIIYVLKNRRPSLCPEQVLDCAAEKFFQLKKSFGQTAAFSQKQDTSR